jgi:DNA repair protein SbcD/Mre11
LRILHTADWHLGKNLEGYSRLDEQETFLQDFIHIVKENNVDLVIIAGDIYDNGNPPARAEKLFYNTLKEISDGGKRAVLVIAGNHDNPERLVAASPLAYEHGVIILGTPKGVAETGSYGQFSVVAAGEGYMEMNIRDEKAVIVTLPYPSEKRLNEIFTEEKSDEERQKSYSERLGMLFEQLSSKYREDTINLAVSHLFVIGGEICDSERSIELGGSYAVEGAMLPKKAQYIALGHLHRPQRIKTEERNIYYAGSPLQYSKSELNYSKSAYLVELVAGGEPKVKELYFRNYKPIEVWKCASI